MFERLTPPARQTMLDAQAEAHGLHHDFLGTEHLLLALAAGTTGPAAQVLHAHGLTAIDLRARIPRMPNDGLDPQALATLGIALQQVRTAAEASFGPGALDTPTAARAPGSNLPLTKHTMIALQVSLSEAQDLHQNYVGTGHLLLALLCEGVDGAGTRLLHDSGLDLDALRAEVTRLITAEAA